MGKITAYSGHCTVFPAVMFPLDAAGEIRYRSLMARMRDEDEEEVVPVIKKRRRPKKKPVVDDDDDDAGPPGRRPQPDDDDEDEEGEKSISTGNVLLDIVLDFRDDCIDWAKEHFLVAVIILSIAGLLFLATFGFTVYCIVKYVNRPTLALTFSAYNLGSYSEAKIMAAEVLKYAKKGDISTRSDSLFILGAATCAMAETAWEADRQPYYLAAAKYLHDAEDYGFSPATRTEGYFLLGKCLYLSGEITPCREPLLRALELNSPGKKLIHWYLAYSYFLDPQPNLQEAVKQIQAFQADVTVTEEEWDESEIFRSMITLQLNDPDGADEILKKVPQRDRFRTSRHFAEGQIAFLYARILRQHYLDLVNNRNPVPLNDVPIAPVPVKPIKPENTEENTEKPDQPVKPIDNSAPTEPKEPKPSPPKDTTLINGSNPSNWAIAPAPVAPAEPNDPFLAAIAPVPTDDDQEAALAKRLASMRSRATGKYAQNTADTNITADKVIVLPPDGKTETKKENAPVPAEFPQGSFTALPKGDPVQENIQKFHDLTTEKYKEAIAHFQEVRRHERFVPRWLRVAELLEGLCNDEMGEFVKAQSIYLKVAETFPGSSEAAAAHFFRAEIERHFNRMESAFRSYSRAFETMRNEPNYACFWLTKDTILERCREIIRNNIRTQEYKEALTLLYLLRGVMSAAESARFRGETYESWAVLLRQQADATLGAAGEKLLRDSYTKYRLSGEAFAEFSQVDYNSSDFTDWVWRSAENFRLGKDYRRAIPQYKSFLRMTVNDHRPEIYLYLGEMYVHIDALDAAAEMMEEAMPKYPNDILIPRFRMVLSRAYVEKKEWEKAKDVLQRNLIDEYSPSSVIYRDSMFALGKLFFEWGNFKEGIPYLEDAVKNYPKAVQTADSHYYLSQIYLKQAADLTKSAKESVLDSVQRQILANADAERERALVHIQKTEELLSKRQEAMELTESEQLMLRNALFGAGSILMDLKRYGQAISELSLVATRYQDRPEILNALIQLTTAYRHMGKFDDAETTLNQAEFVLNRLQKIGSIPAENNWNAIIQNERNFVRNKVRD